VKKSTSGIISYDHIINRDHAMGYLTSTPNTVGHCKYLNNNNRNKRACYFLEQIYFERFRSPFYIIIIYQ